MSKSEKIPFEDMDNQTWNFSVEETQNIANRTTLDHLQAKKEESQVNNGCFGAFIGGLFGLGVIPLVLAFTNHSGWVIVTSLIPCLALGMAIGGGIGTLLGSRIN